MKSNSNKAAVASDDAIRTSYTAVQFEKEMPREAMSRFNRFLHSKLDRAMAEVGPMEAVFRLSKEVTGDSMSFPVVLGDRGCFCVPTIMLGHYGPDTHFWIGFARLSSKATITKVFPLPCFDELKSRVEEIMMAARVL
jgi:hypothetical protein